MDSVGVRLSDNSVVTSPVVTEGVAFTVASFVVAIKTVVADELTLDDEDEVIKGSANALSGQDLSHQFARSRKSAFTEQGVA